MTPDPLAATCPKCRAAPGAPCVDASEPHRARVLAAKALAKIVTPRVEPTTEEKAAQAARKRQRERARDPRMNNDW